MSSTTPGTSGSELTVVQQVAALAYTVSRDGLADDLRNDVARRVLDVVGNSVAARHETPAAAVIAVAKNWGGREAATGIEPECVFRRQQQP